MKETLDLSQHQQLTQRLSPRQVQFARLLEMSAPEIEEEVRRQLDDNPALEIAEPDEPQSAPDDDEGADTGGDDNAIGDEAQDPGSSDFLADVDAPLADPDDDPIDRYPGRSAYADAAAAADVSAWQVADDGPDLFNHLKHQLRQADEPEHIVQIATYIAGNLDENGYSTRTLASLADDLAINAGIEASPQDMRQAFDLLRSLEPAGVGAVDLRDCLLLQLRRITPSSLSLRIAREIVTHYFDLLSKKHYDRLQASLDLDDQHELRKALDLIRRLDPKPGAAFAQGDLASRMAHISPDVAVEIPEGGTRASVSLVSNLPQLQIERTFALDPHAKPATKAEREAQTFIKLKRDDAEAFISAIKQRGLTLLAVTEAIARRQAAFFSTGDSSQIRPMVLRDVAADTGLDMSVISRATAGKYVATPMGVFPLKMFFNEATGSGADAETSSHQVMHALQEIIDAENPIHPLSDLAIQQALAEKGFNVARRTVTKYREKLGLPVGRLRKKL